MVLKKKALKIVVSMSLIVALAISALTLSAKASYENTHYNTGYQADDITGVARTQVGYGEGSDGYTKYGDWYGLPYSDWCAMFVSWCANQAGVDSSVFPSFALCSAGADWFMSQGEFQFRGDYVPKAGDLIFYASYGNIYHVGLVTGADDYNVYSIEGNYNEMVCNVSYPLSYGDILGYATPNYSTNGNISTDDIQEPSTEEEDTYTEADTDEDTAFEVVSDDDTQADDSDFEYNYEDTDFEEADSDVTIDTEEELDTEEVVDTDTETDIDVEVPTTLTGDVNGDGRLDSVDAIIIQRHLIGVESLSDAELARADVDTSGNIDMNDIIAILEIVAGLRV